MDLTWPAVTRVVLLSSCSTGWVWSANNLYMTRTNGSRLRASGAITAVAPNVQTLCLPQLDIVGYLIACRIAAFCSVACQGDGAT